MTDMTSTISARARLESTDQVNARRVCQPFDRPDKIQPHHLERRAVVYVRQSTPQQVLHNRESTELQYKLALRAHDLGWREDRISVIDDDQGQSGRTAEGRQGFQQLMTEVGLNHVGLVLGIEMSRLARSNKDWHQLLELCALFGALLCDQDGLYDPCDYNDRLILGLKGTMSEAELHILRSRLVRGKRNKAERCELFSHAPVGYVRSSSGGLEFDPDEQVQAVVQLIFEKFDDLGSCRALCRYLLDNKIHIPVRPHFGPKRGQLEWHRPVSSTLRGILHHPAYAGAYSYGRRSTDPRRKVSGKRKSGITTVPMNEWQVLRRDVLPAYITWEQFLANQQRMKQNAAQWDTLGAPRIGPTLLGGLVYCGRCGWRMMIAYGSKPGHSARYVCSHYPGSGSGSECQRMQAAALDDLVTEQVLQAIQPAALELSIRAEENIQRERDRLHQHWQQQLERARYQTELARRQYDSVDPENRLVARELEQRWEHALLDERQIVEGYERFQNEQARNLLPEDRERIASLSSDIKALWRAESTNVTDRQEIIRALVERVTVNVQGDTEVVDVTIQWSGGYVSQYEALRPVGRYEKLRDFDQLIVRITELHNSDHTAREIAPILNAEGFRTPSCRKGFDVLTVRTLMSRYGFERRRNDATLLREGEWFGRDLARELKLPGQTLCHWCSKGWLHARKLATANHRWVVWADEEELKRLRALRAYRRSSPSIPYPAELTTPKEKPNS